MDASAVVSGSRKEQAERQAALLRPLLKQLTEGEEAAVSALDSLLDTYVARNEPLDVLDRLQLIRIVGPLVNPKFRRAGPKATFLLAQLLISAWQVESELVSQLPEIVTHTLQALSSVDAEDAPSPGYRIALHALLQGVVREFATSPQPRLQSCCRTIIHYFGKFEERPDPMPAINEAGKRVLEWHRIRSREDSMAKVIVIAGVIALVLVVILGASRVLPWSLMFAFLGISSFLVYRMLADEHARKVRLETLMEPRLLWSEEMVSALEPRVTAQPVTTYTNIDQPAVVIAAGVDPGRFKYSPPPSPRAPAGAAAATDGWGADIGDDEYEDVTHDLPSQREERRRRADPSTAASLISDREAVPEKLSLQYQPEEDEPVSAAVPSGMDDDDDDDGGDGGDDDDDDDAASEDDGYKVIDTQGRTVGATDGPKSGPIDPEADEILQHLAKLREADKTQQLTMPPAVLANALRLRHMVGASTASLMGLEWLDAYAESVGVSLPAEPVPLPAQAASASPAPGTSANTSPSHGQAAASASEP